MFGGLFTQANFDKSWDSILGADSVNSLLILETRDRSRRVMEPDIEVEVLR